MMKATNIKIFICYSNKFNKFLNKDFPIFNFNRHQLSIAPMCQLYFGRKINSYRSYFQEI